MKSEKIKMILYEHPYTNETMRELNNKLRDLEAVKYDTSVTAKISGAPTGGSISRPTENAALKICEFYDGEKWRIVKEVKEILEKQRAIDNAMMKMPQRQREIIKQRYFHKNEWDYIARQIGISKRQCRRIHDEALEQINEAIEVAERIKKW